jgi:hypothetical protein
LGDDLAQGKAISKNAWKPTTDVGREVPGGKRSSYRFSYDGFKMPQKLVFGTPKLPFYQLAWNADSTYKTENKKKEEA